jgi:uncharacterized Zn finger protein
LKSINTLLRKLTFDDLDDWAGSTILNRGKSYVKYVERLSRTQDNNLVAWVNGTDQYTTSVRINAQNDFEYFCSCPYSWGPCKHAVAVILAAAEQVKQKQPIVLLDEDDNLSLALFAYTNEEDDEWVQSSEPQHSKVQAEVETVLAGKSRQEMLDQLVDLAGRNPEIRRQILEAEQLASGQVDKLVRTLLAEIRNLTAEPVWYNHWRDEGNLPDYTHFGERLQALADQGHADAVLKLGGELWTRGNAQVGQSDDDGETGMAIATCMDTVLAALPQTSLSPPEQLLWVIDRVLEDEFCMLDGSADKLLKRRTYTQAHWRKVAGALEIRLQASPKPQTGSFSTAYHRERLLSQLLDAYSYAGWKERTIPLLETEADACRQYKRLTDALLAAGERDRARHWCILGYRRTVKNDCGIAWILQKQLRKMAQSERQHDLAAAYRAQDFFAHPSSTTYHKLRNACKKATCWPAVQNAVFHFLETGQSPAPGEQDKNTGWPLPAPEVGPEVSGKRSGYQQFPDLSTLIDIAIQEKRFDDVVELYQRLCTTGHLGLGINNNVAHAVANTHPQVALDIWKSIVDKLIGRVKPKAYEEAASYLRLMEKIYSQNDRLADWQGLIRGLRNKHRQKRRLLSTLDNLSRKKIVD